MAENYVVSRAIVPMPQPSHFLEMRTASFLEVWTKRIWIHDCTSTKQDRVFAMVDSLGVVCGCLPWNSLFGGLVRSSSSRNDGSPILTDTTIHLWDLSSGLQLCRFVGHSKGVSCTVAFSPDGCYLASGSWDQTVRIWSVQSAVDKGLEKN